MALPMRVARRSANSNPAITDAGTHYNLRRWRRLMKK